MSNGAMFLSRIDFVRKKITDNQRLEHSLFHVRTFPHEILPKSIATDQKNEPELVDM